jgi:hypothetical protein
VETNIQDVGMGMAFNHVTIFFKVDHHLYDPS